MNSVKYSMWTCEISEEINNNVEEIYTQNEGLSKVLKVIQHDCCYIFKKEAIWFGLAANNEIVHKLVFQKWRKNLFQTVK